MEESYETTKNKFNCESTAKINYFILKEKTKFINFLLAK